MKNFKTRTFSKFHTLNLTQRPELMARSGYAHLVKGYTAFKTPPPTSANYHERLVTLSRFIARTAFPEKGREARQHYANKDYAAVLNLELARDEELHIDHLSKFVDETPKVEPLDRLQLQIMVLETRIFRQTRVSCLSTISSKFQDPILKSKYRIWAQSISGPAAVAAVDASQWLQHDSEPNLAVVVPELSDPLQFIGQLWRYPPLMAEWWKRGFVTATVIDSLGTRAHCQVWELRKHLGSQSFKPALIDVIRWALQAEAFKIEVQLVWLQRYLDAQQKWLRLGCPGKVSLNKLSAYGNRGADGHESAPEKYEKTWKPRSSNKKKKRANKTRKGPKAPNFMWL